MANTSARGGAVRGFEHPVAFWAGTAACSIGVLLHLPMYYSARHMGYQMSGMSPDAPMVTGMTLILAGLPLVLYGLLPRRSGELARTAARVRVRPLDDAPLRAQHVILLMVMAVAVTIDVMKPATLSFITPGVAKEYHLLPTNKHSHTTVAWLPLFGIGGTVLGSWLWGSLGDRIGRRASIMFAGILFVSTSICGTMPSFGWNLVMCLLMGIGAGGMLPVAFTLLSETMPKRHRGWTMMLVGGEVAAAYVLVSSLSAWLTPHYSWRIMWLIGLPTGLLLIALNRWIPESPRYLITRGRVEEAEAVMARYGAVVSTVPAPEAGPGLAADTAPTDPAPTGPGLEADPASHRGSVIDFVRRPMLGTSIAIALLGLGVGLVTYGFQQWVPTNIQRLGYSAVASDYVVRNAALIGLPLTILAAWMYGVLGSRRTIIAFCVLTAATLIGFVVAGDSLAHNRLLLSVLLVVPLSGTSSLAAVAVGYAAEVYPTRVRTRGAGLAAGMTKLGGVLILAVVVARATVPSIAQTAVIGAVPLAAAILAFWWIGAETKGRSLEAIAGEELVGEPV
ncbi:MFS transporter [Catenulispora sp. NL8]|uniref:MFS transporter n=1 Tax=Catenulispora pinistramenti TaxID=2705254 RepID=A0ABS5KXM5_9ACTN|nr:MFS transporter [Catenulispora pinistramenti]MBS2550801.1 MFS transporter [Catenulispora pinistramenti]